MNDIFGSSQEDHEEAYGEGKSDSEDAGFFESIAHDINDIVPDTTILGAVETSEHESYEAGYHSSDSDDDD